MSISESIIATDDSPDDSASSESDTSPNSTPLAPMSYDVKIGKSTGDASPSSTIDFHFGGNATVGLIPYARYRRRRPHDINLEMEPCMPRKFTLSDFVTVRNRDSAPEFALTKAFPRCVRYRLLPVFLQYAITIPLFVLIFI